MDSNWSNLMFVHKHTFAPGSFGKVPSQLPSKDKIYNHNTSAALSIKKTGMFENREIDCIRNNE